MKLIKFIYMPAFNQAWDNLGLTAEDKEDLDAQILSYLAAAPDNNNGRIFPGSMIEKTGGAYKLRYARSDSNEGKSGGYRILYVAIHRSSLYFLDVFPKSKKENISDAEKVALKHIVQRLKKG